MPAIRQIKRQHGKEPTLERDPSNPDPYWRWHDAMGLKRPGGPANPTRAMKARKDGVLVVKPKIAPALIITAHLERPKPVEELAPTPARSPLRALESWGKLRALKRALRRCDDILKAQFAGFAESNRKTVYHPITLRHWRKLNVAIAKLEFVQIPIEERGEPVPSNLRRPRDHYSGGSLLEYTQVG